MKRRLSLIVFFVVAHLGTLEALTLSEIRTEIRVLIKDTDATRRRYTDGQLNSLVNQAHRDVVNHTWMIKKNTEIELTAGATHYSLATDTIQIQRVTWKFRNLKETSLEQLDSRFSYGDWYSSGGSPDSYYQDPARPDQLSIYPWPNSSSSTGTVRINYFAEAPTLSADSDTPFNADSRHETYHDLLINWPAYKVYLVEGDINKAASYKALYDEKLTLAVQQIGSNPNYKPSFGGQRQ